MGIKDKLPEQKPIALLKELDQTSHEIKSRQTRASASVINYRIFSLAPYDIIVPGGFAKNVVEIEFVSNSTRLSGSLCYRVYVSVVDATATPYIDEVGLRRLLIDPNGARQRWFYQCSFSSATKLKFYFFAQGSGTFTAKLI